MSDTFSPRWQPYFLALVFLMAAMSGGVFFYAWSFHANFLIEATCDTAAYHSTVVNLISGHGFRTSAWAGPNILGQHSVLILALVAAFYAVAPYLQTLILLQIVSVYSSVIPLYWIALYRLKKVSGAFFVAFIALISPFFFNLALVPFHPEILMLPFVFWAYYFYQRNRVIGFCAMMGLAMSCTELAALIFISLGIGLLMDSRGSVEKKKFAFLALASGVFWIVFYFEWLLPAIYQPIQRNLFLEHYSQLGFSSPFDLIRFAAKHATLFVFAPFDAERWLHVVEIAGPVFVLALASWESFPILFLPSYSVFLMDADRFFFRHHAYYFQYAFFAGCLGLICLLTHLEKRSILKRISCVVILIMTLLTTFDAWIYADQNPQYRRDEFNGKLISIFDAIPRSAGVFCQHRYSGFLSNRVNMVMGDLAELNVDFDALIERRYPETNVHSGQIDFIVCDLRSGQCDQRELSFVLDEYNKRKTAIAALLQSGTWRVWWQQNEVIILKRMSKS